MLEEYIVPTNVFKYRTNVIVNGYWMVITCIQILDMGYFASGLLRMMVMDYGNVCMGNIHWTFVGFIGGQDDTVLLWTFIQITFSVEALGVFRTVVLLLIFL